MLIAKSVGLTDEVQPRGHVQELPPIQARAQHQGRVEGVDVGMQVWEFLSTERAKGTAELELDWSKVVLEIVEIEQRNQLHQNREADRHSLREETQLIEAGVSHLKVQF